MHNYNGLIERTELCAEVNSVDVQSKGTILHKNML